MVLTRFEVAERVIEHFALPRFTGANQPDAALTEYHRGLLAQHRKQSREAQQRALRYAPSLF
jgi:hypothetical protein